MFEFGLASSFDSLVGCFLSEFVRPQNLDFRLSRDAPLATTTRLTSTSQDGGLHGDGVLLLLLATVQGPPNGHTVTAWFRSCCPGKATQTGYPQNHTNKQTNKQTSKQTSKQNTHTHTHTHICAPCCCTFNSIAEQSIPSTPAVLGRRPLELPSGLASPGARFVHFMGTWYMAGSSFSGFGPPPQNVLGVYFGFPLKPPEKGYPQQ